MATATADTYSGILGLGHGEGTISYKNFIDQLQAQGVTETKAFSLALGSKDEQEGVVIFGGVDTGKYAGRLRALPIIPAQAAPGGVTRYWIRMNAVGFTTPDGTPRQYRNSAMDIFLDSGSTLTLLPPAMVETIASNFGGRPSTSSSGLYLVDCSLARASGSLDFAFEGVTIRVPLHEIVRESVTSSGSSCYLGIQASDRFTLLGDTFLRSAYAVFDQTSNAIYLAQYANCGTNQVEITRSTRLDGMSGQCSSPSFLPSATATNPAGQPGASPTGIPAGYVPPSTGVPNAASFTVLEFSRLSITCIAFTAMLYLASSV